MCCGHEAAAATAAAAAETGLQIPTSSVIDVDVSPDAVDSDTSDSVSGPSSHMEPVSAVIGRYLQKATTAPPNIKQFFKPKPPVNSVTADTSESELETKDVVPDDKDDDDDDIVIVTATECEPPDNRTNGFRQESVVPRTVGKSNKTAATKRVSVSSLPAAKKPKQSSIAALFSQSTARNLQKQPPTPMQCPICSRTFDETVSNADVNEHIDGCLIE